MIAALGMGAMGCARGYPIALLLTVQLALALKLFSGGNDFGLYKLAMFLQPALFAGMAALVLRVRPGSRMPWILAGLYFITTVPTSVHYTVASCGLRAGGLTELRHASRLGLSIDEPAKPQSQIKRLMPNYEYCLHFVKDVKDYRWRDFINWKDGEFKLVKSSNERELSKKRENHSWTLQKPIERFRSFLSEQKVSRVLQANGFLWKELEEIDPAYRHQAPYPSVIPLLPMLLTTKIGDTVLDIYNGTSTTTAVALQLGCKAIGYDIDNVNHQFAAKRLQMVEQNLPTNAEILALEAEFICDRSSDDYESISAAA